uniref:RING-type domain-containing protein n=1 Tax=Panagrellus redivivus TaxID=6233 RepID=A0A7E4UNW8_PANRE
MSFTPYQLKMAKCEFCSEFYTANSRAPILTSCGHTFCRQCVENSYIVNNVYTCYDCQEPTLIEGNGLKVNVGFLRCLEMMKLLAPETVYYQTIIPKRAEVAVDKRQQLVESITAQLTEVVFQNGNDRLARDIIKEVEQNMSDYADRIENRDNDHYS